MKSCFILLICMLLGSFAQSQPAANLKNGYTYKVPTGVPGKLVYISGQRPFNASGNLVGANNLTQQTEQVFENLQAALSRIGMSFRDVTQITYRLKGDPAQVDPVAAQQAAGVGTAYFAGISPKISKTTNSAKIVRDDILIEIEVVAVK